MSEDGVPHRNTQRIYEAQPYSLNVRLYLTEEQDNTWIRTGNLKYRKNIQMTTEYQILRRKAFKYFLLYYVTLWTLVVGV
jgi:hypothetical protein